MCYMAGIQILLKCISRRTKIITQVHCTYQTFEYTYILEKGIINKIELVTCIDL